LIALAEAGIDKKLSSRSQKLAAMPEAKFEADLAGWRELVAAHGVRVSTQGMHHRGTGGTGENEWYTPARELAAAREVLGEFDLDPGSSHRAQETVRAKKYFTIEDDGLARDWHGRVWLNPPYEQPHIANFVDKLVAEYCSGRVTSAIMLTHNCTDTKWFHKAANVADAFCFTSGRIKFYNAEGVGEQTPQGQAFLYFGDDVAAFGRVFSRLGVVGTFGIYDANPAAGVAP
jgi:phage N-6-adenine-methyltransferase